MKLYLGNRNYSSWSLRGWLAARLSGLPFEAVPVSLSGASPNHPWLREWERDALAETEVIAADEPRVVYRNLLAASR